MVVKMMSSNVLKVFIEKKEYKNAVFFIEKALINKPADVFLHNTLGEVLLMLSEQESALQSLSRIVDDLPSAYYSQLILARLIEKKGQNFEDAFKNYIQALKKANKLGFWLNNASTASWCRNLVIHAVNFVEKWRRDFISFSLEELYKLYGKSALERIALGVRMYVGDLPLALEDERQVPSFLYIPGLPAKPVFERTDVSFIDYFESCYSVILSELQLLVESNKDISSYQGEENNHALTQGGNWDALFFYRHGVAYDETHILCPKTSGVLNNLPIVRIKDHSPEVCFSVLRPGAHILPHRGVTNSRSVLHLGLKIPSMCCLSITGITNLTWNEGKAFVFDDTYLHEAWNKSEESRFVLLADVWNPFLTDVEQAAISDLVVKIGLINNFR